MSRKTKEAAAIRATQQIAKRKRRNIIASVATVLILAGVGYAAGTYINKPIEASSVATWDVSKIYPTDIAFGNPNAPLRITEYGSLTCIHCAQFHAESLPTVLKQYVDTGKVHFVFRHFPYDGAGFAGAQAVSCLKPEERASAVTALLSGQRSWVQSETPGEAAMDVIGLEGEKRQSVQTCLSEDRFAKPIGEITMEAQAAGISSTPTFVIGKEVYPGFIGASAFGRIIDTKIETQNFAETN
jgi:protein-disulfide isomerase